MSACSLLALAPSIANQPSLPASLCLQGAFLHGRASSFVCGPRQPAVAMAHLLDTAMAKYGGKSWALRVLGSPASGAKSKDMIEDPISLPDFVAAICRKLTGMSVVQTLFDVQMSVPEFAPLNQAEAVRRHDTQSLPESICPRRDLPDGCRLGLVLCNMEDGTLQVVKIFNFRERLPAKQAVQYCAGTPYGLVQRPGPWALKKALLSLIQRLPGFHVSRFA